MSLTVAEVKDLLEISSTSHDTTIAALLPLVTEQVNEYCGGAFSRQVKEEEVTFTTIGTSTYKTLNHNPVVRNSVYVTSTDRSYIYYGDPPACDYANPAYLLRGTTNIEEYALDYEGGRIYVPSTLGRIEAADVCYVTYSYIDLFGGSKYAVSKLIQQGYTHSPGIGSESVGSLSRSYVNGTDPLVVSLLSPYRRPRMV